MLLLFFKLLLLFLLRGSAYGGFVPFLLSVLVGTALLSMKVPRLAALFLLRLLRLLVVLLLVVVLVVLVVLVLMLMLVLVKLLPRCATWR